MMMKAYEGGFSQIKYLKKDFKPDFIKIFLISFLLYDFRKEYVPRPIELEIKLPIVLFIY